MAITRRMTAKLNQDSCSRKTPNTIDNDGDSGSWSYLIHDILISIISRLGVIDFVSISCVCKSWRTFALLNRKMFMLSRQPMSIRIYPEVPKKKVCYLEDLQGRKFKTILPRSSGRIFLGLVSGYLILFGWKARDFKLVNPITRHELHFPRFDFYKIPAPEHFGCILAFSSKMSKWVFVVSVRYSSEVSFSFSRERAYWTGGWTRLSSDFPIRDLHFFQGKIYALSDDILLCEVRLSPTPTLTLLKMKNYVNSEVKFSHLTTWGEKLYVVGYHPLVRFCAVFEVDFDQMRWLNSEIALALKENVCFVKFFKSCVAKLEFWTDSCGQFEWFGTDKNNNKRIHITEDMWYCPHKCLDVNLLHE
ncbi:hypothetical protein SSX86_028181 [Deinandra increscens subsp. villosa]|uniref:F-box domain-containing protein n=1 Tax=Deinandra increscens subsp. villosa TaxID=3103831 RepID=A0AAP0GKK0_9ASTR